MTVLTRNPQFSLRFITERLGEFTVQQTHNNPFLVGHSDRSDTLVSRYQRFGFRAAEFSTPYFSMERDLRERQVRLKLADIRKEGTEGTRRLRLAVDHNDLLQDGQITMRGHERTQIGDYIRLTDRKDARYYVEFVHHDFKVGTEAQDGHFLTHLALSRGRGHLVNHYGLLG